MERVVNISLKLRMRVKSSHQPWFLARLSKRAPRVLPYPVFILCSAWHGDNGWVDLWPGHPWIRRGLYQLAYRRFERLALPAFRGLRAGESRKDTLFLCFFVLCILLPASVQYRFLWIFQERVQMLIGVSGNHDYWLNLKLKSFFKTIRMHMFIHL